MNRFKFAHAHAYRRSTIAPPPPPLPPSIVNHGGALKLDRSYNFVEKPGVVHELSELIRNSGLTYTQIAEASGLSTTCIQKLFAGKTVGPRRTTLEAIANVFGKRLALVDADLVVH